MIRCIQIGWPNGPIAQGPATLETVRNHSTGEYETTGYATVRDGETEYFGRIIETVRRGAALPPAAGNHAHTLGRGRRGQQDRT